MVVVEVVAGVRRRHWAWRLGLLLLLLLLEVVLVVLVVSGLGYAIRHGGVARGGRRRRVEGGRQQTRRVGR